MLRGGILGRTGNPSVEKIPLLLSHRTRPTEGKLGAMGALNRASLFLPGAYLTEHHPLSSQRELGDLDQTLSFSLGSFLAFAISNEHIDVLHVMIHELELNLEEQLEGHHTAY